jgi:two-component system, chemotaxis family, sensor kinase CheA
VFGHNSAGQPFYAVLSRGDSSASFALEASYLQLMADVLPRDIALDQIPKTLTHGDRTHSLALTLVVHEDQLSGALLVTRDVTADLRTRQVEAEQRERARIIERVLRDRPGFVEFFEEARAILSRIGAVEDSDSKAALRDLHTLKGMAAVFDVESIAGLVHSLERAITEHDVAGAREAKLRLLAGWDAFLAFVRPLLGDGGARLVEVPEVDLVGLIAAVRAHEQHTALLQGLVRLTHEPVERRFARMAEQVRRLARRLRKAEPAIVVDAGGVRLPPERFRTFWASLTHVIRNLVDHGLEDEAARLQAGKTPQNRVELRARRSDTEVWIEVIDDGRGIDWQRLKERAAAKGLAAETPADLTAALFADGVSTSAAVTEVSGRGVGLSAVRQACEEIDGTIAVQSERGQGTRFRFAFRSVETESALRPQVSLRSTARRMN